MTQSWPVKRTESYGGVVVRPAADGHDVLLIRPRADADKPVVWALPKGAKEEGEAPEQAAKREVVEETGIIAEVVEPLEPITYWFAWAPEQVRYRKTVHFFLMRPSGGEAVPDGFEVSEVGFFPLATAHKKASYASERKVLQAAADRVASW
jgi:ADP-ribose pyrophosphatase YjhB (NUDIX family)